VAECGEKEQSVAYFAVLRILAAISALLATRSVFNFSILTLYEVFNMQ